MAEYSINTVLEPSPPFNFDLLTGLYAKWPMQSIELYDRGYYQRTISFGALKCLMKIKSKGTVEKPALDVTLFSTSSRIGKLEIDRVRETVEWIFSTRDDLSGFYIMLRQHPVYSILADKLYGLKPPKTPTVFESIIIAISEQEIALKAAISIRMRLIEKFGSSFRIKGKTYYLFPSPSDLIKATPEDIRKIGFTYHKAGYMLDISSRILSGKVDVEKMKTMDSGEIIKIFKQVKGFGPWTIKYILTRGLGRYDVVPFEDLGLRNGLTRLLGRSERISQEEAADFFKPFGQYKGYFSFYLLYDHLLNLSSISNIKK